MKLNRNSDCHAPMTFIAHSTFDDVYEMFDNQAHQYCKTCLPSCSSGVGMTNSFEIS